MDKQTDNLELTNDTNSINQASTFDEVRIAKESHDMNQRPSPNSGTHTEHSNQEGRSISMTPEKTFDSQNYRNTLHTGSSISQEGSALSIIPEKEPNTSQGASDPLSESDQENFIVALRPEKGLDKLPLRRNADNVVHATHSDQGVTFSKLPEKPSGDGYNWRKYGQKLVRGNTFVRSYYKCTFANCPARKQVERSHDGQITEINYLWKHEHPKPPHTLLKGTAFVVPVQAKGPNEPPLTMSEDHSSIHPATSNDPEETQTQTHRHSGVPTSENLVEVAVSHSNETKSEVNNDIPSDSKRQKRENDGISTKTSCEPRVVVQTTSVVDIVNDGYRWRKYGQKLVKGNPNPRSYYRCSSGGCPAKKHVERASHDEKVVITTYEGRHDHDMPTGGRTVTQNTTSTTSVENDGSKPHPEARESSGMEMVLHVSAT